MKNINRILSVFFAATILLSALIIGKDTVNAADVPDFIADITDNDILSGSTAIGFFAKNGGNTEVTVDGEPLSITKSSSFLLCFDAAQVDYGNSEFRINGETIGLLKGNGSGSIALDISLLEKSEIIVDFFPSTGTAPLDTSKVYGTYNIDDLTVNAVYLLSESCHVQTYPTKVILKYPIPGKDGVTEKQVDYNKGSLFVGDGWNSETGMGGTTPDKPICFSLVFDLTAAEQQYFSTLAQGSYTAAIDTTKYRDGSHELCFKNGDSEIKRTVIFDNTPPEITTSPEKSGIYDENTTLDITVNDANPDTVAINIDGKKYQSGSSLARFADGKWHTLTVIATDKCANTQTLVREFKLTDSDNCTHHRVQYGSTVTADSGTLYRVNSLTSSAKDGVITVKAPENGKMIMHLTAASDEDADIAYSMVANDGSLREIAVIPCGITRSVIVDDITEEYINADGNVTVKAEKVRPGTSESDTLVWITDTQYYTRFDDLLPKYEAALDYYADLYKNGKAGFLIHTGDVADEYSPEANVKKQLEAASKLHHKLDEAGIPYGIVNGNHDVGQSLHDSKYFSQYFGTDRFAGNPWYRGSLNNNESHYDLITLGGYDFLLLWLGYGVEDDDITVTWANDILARYPSRNAIILTHAYLDSDGSWLINEAQPQDYTHSRAREIWEDIVVPNDNVVAVFCGHTNGAARNLRKVDENRSVWEILSDYQFVEDGTEPKHILNGMTCDGEGFIRTVTFTGTEMIQKTYSPYSGKTNPFGNDADEFTVPLALKKQNNSIDITVDCYAVVSEVALDGNAVEVSGYIVVSTDEYTLVEGSGGFEPDTSDTSGIEPSDTVSDTSADLSQGSHSSIIWFILAPAVVIALVAAIAISRKRKK